MLSYIINFERKTMASTTFHPKVTRHRRLSNLKNSLNWFYLLPALIFFVAYMLYPLIQVFYISFTDYHYLRNDPINFTGLQNYTNAAVDPIFLVGLWRAFVFTLIFLPDSGRR